MRLPENWLALAKEIENARSFMAKVCLVYHTQKKNKQVDMYTTCAQNYGKSYVTKRGN